MDTKVIICGSGAAEGVPAYFCGCRVCSEAARLGGRECRWRTSYNFGGDIQIDFGPDSLQAYQAHRDTMSKIRHILVTHAHEDHLAPEELDYLRKGFCNVPMFEGPITIHGTRPTFARMDRELRTNVMENRAEKVYRDGRLILHEIAPFQTFEIPDNGAIVRTFRANHAPELDPLVFIVTLRGRTVLFCNDTGYLPEESWKAFEEARGQFHLDLAILDNTGALLDWRNGHMGAQAVLDTLERLSALGFVDQSTVKVVNHFSHNSGSTYSELVAYYEPRGILVGYDGMTL